MKFRRAGGVLLHPTSLPGPYGIGDLGPQAHRFVDWLAAAGCKLWQVLPLGPTGYGDSPYQCLSAFAGNPNLISPDLLFEDGLLTRADLENRPDFPPARVDYGAVIAWKNALLERAFERFLTQPGPARSDPATRLRADFDSFCAENGATERSPERPAPRGGALGLSKGSRRRPAEVASWLADFALFMALKESHGGGAWDGWPASLRRREAESLAVARESLPAAIERHKFYQFIFYRQWNALHAHAARQGIQIIGDIPIFTAYDSADVWARPELFHLDEERRPTVVAGVPPDYFSPTGQLWGNPLYRWDVHQQSGYAWWLERLRAVLQTVDIVRLDHFRGFAGYWEIPAGNPTAEIGRWAPGPGADFFQAVQIALSDPEGRVAQRIETEGVPPGSRRRKPEVEALPIIAEDLGVITAEVTALREQFHLPGMKILQFAFTGPENPFLPHHYPRACVVYSGTHDNDTARGWFASAPEDEREFARRYLNSDGRDFAWDLMRAAWSSVAVFAIAPMQDLLDLGSEARMNYPSKSSGNWRWRMSEEALSDELGVRLRGLNELYSR